MQIPIDGFACFIAFWCLLEFEIHNPAVAESKAVACVTSCNWMPVMWPDFNEIGHVTAFYLWKYWCTGLSFLLIVNDPLVINLTFQKLFSSHSQLNVLTLSVIFILSYITLSCKQTSSRINEPCQSNIAFKEIQHPLFLNAELPGSLEAPESIGN